MMEFNCTLLELHTNSQRVYICVAGACNVGFDLQSTLRLCHSMDTEVKVPTIKFQWSKASDVEIEQYRMKS